jgi:hypothetical protein
MSDISSFDDAMVWLSLGQPSAASCTKASGKSFSASQQSKPCTKLLPRPDHTTWRIFPLRNSDDRFESLCEMSLIDEACIHRGVQYLMR